MTAITFDTHEAVKALRDAGLDERTAEAVVGVVKQTTAMPDISHLATKDDLKLAEAKLIYWVVGTGAALTIVNVALKLTGIS